MTTSTRTNRKRAYLNIGLIAALAAGLGLLDARPAAGQGLGAVQGTVVDDGGGAALAGAVVALEELGLSTTTGSDGTFVIDEIPAGDYTLTVTREGFAPLTSRVTVAAGPPVRLDLRLPVAEFEEQVVVTGIRSELALAEESYTGSRLGLSAMDIPASLDVIDSSVMEARGYQRISDAVETTPGVVVGQNPAAPSSFSMRGFTRSQITVLRDGIWLGPANMVMRPQNTFNLDCVEVLRGPSSVLNGQGAVAGAVVDLHSDVVAYGQLSSAKDPVDANIFLVNANRDFDLTDARQWEVGLKADLAGGRSQLTAAWFDIERDDVLEQFARDSATTIGGIASRGLELAAAANPSEAARVGASLAFTDAVFLPSANFVQFAGNTPPNVPMVLTNLWGSYRNTGGAPVEIGGAVRVVGDRQANNANTIVLNGYALADAWIAWVHDRVRVTFTIDNLTDVAAAPTAFR